MLKNARFKITKMLPDKLYLSLRYKSRFGRFPNFKSPKTFSEKIQWLKLYDRRPEYTTMVDKYAVKKYVANKIGEQYIIPTLGVWDKFDDIDFDNLPNQFVLKCTHDSGGLIICRDKAKLVKKTAKKKIEESLKRNFYYIGREWPYKKVKPRIIAEKYMEDSETTELRDYKFFCFNGEPVYCQVISNRSKDETIDFFDMNWNHQEFTGLALPNKNFSIYPIPMPFTLDQMINSARVLAKDIPFIRVDFYEIKKKMYFGELTFYPTSGFGKFSPDNWNLIIGKKLQFPNNEKSE